MKVVGALLLFVSVLVLSQDSGPDYPRRLDAVGAGAAAGDVVWWPTVIKGPPVPEELLIEIRRASDKESRGPKMIAR